MTTPIKDTRSITLQTPAQARSIRTAFFNTLLENAMREFNSLVEKEQ